MNPGAPGACSFAGEARAGVTLLLLGCADWTAPAPEHSGGGVRGLTIEVNDPLATARRWAAVLGIAVTGGGQATVVELPAWSQWLRFVPARAAGGEGITAITIAGLPGGGPWMIGGVRFASEEG